MTVNRPNTGAFHIDPDDDLDPRARRRGFRGGFAGHG
jgi:hypothetical protein